MPRVNEVEVHLFIRAIDGLETGVLSKEGKHADEIARLRQYCA